MNRIKCSPILLIGLIPAIYAMFTSQPAFADEQVVTTVVSGTWYAAVHTPSMTAPPDVCMAANPPSGFGLRADMTGVVVWVVNDTWSLPMDVVGAVQVSLPGWQALLDIKGNTSTMVTATINQGDLLPMFAAMDKASVMTVTVGKARPFTVSLAGSTRVTDAFRTCAGIGSNSKTPGSNPFQ